MKFGRNLHRYKVVEWAPFYIDYQALKQLYKAAKSRVADHVEDADFTGLSCIIFPSSDLTGAQNSEHPWTKIWRKRGFVTRTSMKLFGRERRLCAIIMVSPLWQTWNSPVGLKL